MSISMKELFGRGGIEGEVISLRHSLSTHPGGLSMGLREAHERLLQPADGDGFARGCCRPDSVEIGVPILGGYDLGGVLPSWVPVAGNTHLVRDHRPDTPPVRLDPDYEGETRTVEGVLDESKIAHIDFPFQAWHTYYDWQFYVRVDEQYTYLLSEGNLRDPHFENVLECEWDTGDPDGEGFLPKWAWPQRGDRVWIVGRWIYDCGHPEDGKHRAEIHPPKAVASFRQEAVDFPENDGPVRANTAVLYIGRNGGYWRQPINNQDYAFDLHLPPRPYAEAEPVWRVTSGTGALPVRPEITPYPAHNPTALRVVVPLEGVEPHPEEYGAGIAGGWSDPRGTESADIIRLRVTVEELRIDDDHEPGSGKEWFLYVGINGRWEIWKGLDETSEALDYSVDLELHPEDQVHITATGFEADAIHNATGTSIGLSWAEINDSRRVKENAEKIRNGFLSLVGGLDSGIRNDEISPLSVRHGPQARPSDTAASEDGDYRLGYRIEER